MQAVLARNKTRAKRLAYRAAQACRIVPTIWMMRNPFKIYEYERVVEGAGLRPDHAVLDLGCGKGFQTQVLARSCRSALGIDVSDRQIAAAREFLVNSCVADKVQFRSGPLEKAGLPAASFDRVFSFCVLEHIPNLDEVLAEIVRLLRPGGELHVSVDALGTVKDPALLEQHRRLHHVVQYFTEESLRRQFDRAGLETYETFPIMTGDFARQAFESRIAVDDYTHGLLDRVRFHRSLVDDDRRAAADAGIMIVARARRRQDGGRRGQ